MIPLADRVLAWLLDRLGFLPEPLPRVIALPAFTIGLYMTFAFVIRRLVPWLGQRVVAPVALGLVTFGCAAMLMVEFVVAAGYRVARRRPVSLLYGFGDLTVAATVQGQRWIEAGAANLSRMRRFRALILLLVVLTALWWWNTARCSRVAPPCTAPFSDWVDAIREIRG